MLLSDTHCGTPAAAAPPFAPRVLATFAAVKLLAYATISTPFDPFTVTLLNLTCPMIVRSAAAPVKRWVEFLFYFSL